MVNYKDIQKLTKERSDELKNIIAQKEKALVKAPEGMLRAAKCKNTIQYFIRSGANDYTGTYIKKKDRSFAAKLAQKEYDQIVLNNAKEELSRLESLNRHYSKHPFETALDRMQIGKKELIRPINVSDEDYIANWISQELHKNDHYSEGLRYETANGVKMRSKSEVLIANVLDEFGIPYLYEKPLQLDDGMMLLPDFTLLDVKNKKEVYLEHFGLIDEPEYMARTFEKIREYEANGYFLGQGLMITYESSDRPLDLGQFRRMIEGWVGVS